MTKTKSIIRRDKKQDNTNNYNKKRSSLKESVIALPDISHLSTREKNFIIQYPIDEIGVRAAIRAGYARSSAASVASRLLKNKNIRTHIDAAIAGKHERIRMSRDMMIDHMEEMINADPNELCQIRRLCCRHCWGTNFTYQETPWEHHIRKLEYEQGLLRAAANKTVAPIWDDIIEVGFHSTKDPHPECPECDGEGVPQVFFNDTRYLSKGARSLFIGAEISKDGIKLNSENRFQVVKQFTHIQGWNDQPPPTGAFPNVAKLDALYATMCKEAKERDKLVAGRSERLAKMEEERKTKNNSRG